MSGESIVAGDGNVVDELRDVLAGVVGADPERVDPHQPFAALGLDSLLTAELVAAIHQHFGVHITGGALYEYSTPALLAGHLSALREGRSVSAARTPGASSQILEALCLRLAARLHCDPWEIDANVPFTALGIDSILAADFVAGVNDAYGLDEGPLSLHEHPTLAAMASYIGAHPRTTTGISGTPAMPPNAGDAPTARAGLGGAPAVSRTGGKAPAAASDVGSARADVLGSGGAEGAVREVLAALRERLAGVLHCEPWEIEGGVFLSELGIGSQLADDFVAEVNRTYGLDECPVTVHEQRSLAAMAAYVATRTRGTVTDAARTSRESVSCDAPASAGAESEPTPPLIPAASRPALSQEEMLALLDAVRGERIGVDEAAALLTGRSA
jgi:acyl carrier protein